MSFKNYSTPGLALHSPQFASSWGRRRLWACSSLRTPPPSPVPSPFIYSAEQAGSSVRGGGGRIRCNPDFCFFSRDQNRARQRRKQSPDCTISAAARPSSPKGSAPGLWQKRRESPGQPGSSPAPRPGLARWKRRQPRLLHRKSLPPSGRIPDSAAGEQGLP